MDLKTTLSILIVSVIIVYLLMDVKDNFSYSFTDAYEDDNFTEKDNPTHMCGCDYSCNAKM